MSDPKKYNLEGGAEDGAYIYGLFLEGCRWSCEDEVLSESHPKVLYTQMPHIWLRPAKMSEINRGHSYQCPIYKTSRRAGTLSTTGHSTNFVMHTFLKMQKTHDEKHWVKRGVALLTQLND
jgi:dynein heavy chain